MVPDVLLKALTNLVVLVFLPFGLYATYHRWRKKRDWREILTRAGLRTGEGRYIWYAAGVALIIWAVMLIWPLSLEPYLREGSPQQPFIGLGFTGTSLIMALLYGVVQTGFSEEFFFRGLIAGSLARRLPFVWANLIQAVIFLLPHLLILVAMPEMSWLLPVVFLVALLKGWLRVRSGSIVGPWILHASGNVWVCLDVAIRTAGM